MQIFFQLNLSPPRLAGRWVLFIYLFTGREQKREWVFILDNLFLIECIILQCFLENDDCKVLWRHVEVDDMTSLSETKKCDNTNSYSIGATWLKMDVQPPPPTTTTTTILVSE